MSDTEFKEVDPFVRDYIIGALKPVIECLQTLADEDMRPGWTMVPLLPMQKEVVELAIGQLQNTVDSLTPMPEFTPFPKVGR